MAIFKESIEGLTCSGLEQKMLLVTLGDDGFTVKPLEMPVRRVDFSNVRQSDDERGEFFIVCMPENVEKAKGMVLEKRLEWVKRERDGMLEDAERYAGVISELEGMSSRISGLAPVLVDWCEVSFWAGGNWDFRVSQRQVPANDSKNFPECEVECIGDGQWGGRCLASKLGECKKSILDECEKWLREKIGKLERQLEKVAELKGEGVK